MNSFLLAMQFLTIFPLKIRNFSDKKMSRALIYFPIVGLFLGLILSGLNILLSISNILMLASNIILVIILIILTGGMHLDGLADTADAFLSGKEKKEMLEIMRDSHIGVMGVLALISVILLKIGLLTCVNTAIKPGILMLVCILSRWSVVLQMYFFPYARQDGKAKIFIEGMSLKKLILSAIITIVLAFMIRGTEGLIVLLVISVFAYVLGGFVSRKIGGITGDTLGATIELAEVISLLTINITQGIIYV